MTRPDLSYDMNVLSSKVSKATQKTLKELNRILAKTKESRSKIRFVRLGDIKNLRIKVFADASFCNQDNGHTGKIDLKDPGQIPVVAVTDCKSVRESVHSTPQ